MKRCIVLLLGLLATLPAMADVLYRWHTVTDAPDLPGFRAELRITDDAYWRGHAFLDFAGCAGTACALQLADAGIVYIGYAFALGSDGHQPPLASGVYDKFDLHFDRLGGVAGNIRYNTTAVELEMSGQARWNVDLLRGDPYIGTPCGGPGFCSGSTGYFLAERLPVRVPEPGTLWLTGAGLAALAMRRRRFSLARFRAYRAGAGTTRSAGFLRDQSPAPA